MTQRWAAVYVVPKAVMEFWVQSPEERSFIYLMEFWVQSPGFQFRRKIKKGKKSKFVQIDKFAKQPKIRQIKSKQKTYKCPNNDPINPEKIE